jgi:hypothetical protein
MQLRAPNALKANSSYGALRSFSAFLPCDESVRSRKRIYRNPPGSALNIEAFALKRYRQKKSDMDVLREFQKSLEGRRPSTIRLYMAGARAAIEAAKPNIAEYGSYAELLPRIRENPPKGRIRIKPFLRFLAAAEANNSISSCDVQVTQDWVIQAVERHMRAQKNPSIATRRDLALIASLCCGPARGNPRQWPQNCIHISGTDVLLWGKRVEEPAFALALRFWHAWRERLARPDQRRLYRKASQWSDSKLLFPGPRGGALGRAALHNALRRLLAGVGEGSNLTPEKVRAAFLSRDALEGGSRTDALPAL